MAITVTIPTALQRFADNQASVEVTGPNCRCAGRATGRAERSSPIAKCQAVTLAALSTRTAI